MTRAILEYSISSFYKNEHVWPTYFKDIFISHWFKGLLQNTDSVKKKKPEPLAYIQTIDLL